MSKADADAWRLGAAAYNCCGDSAQRAPAKDSARAAKAAKADVTIRIPIKAHIVRRSNGQGGIAVNDVVQGLSRANTDFAATPFEFYLSGINYIDNDNFYSLPGTDRMEDLFLAENDSDVLNLYCVSQIQGFGGYAYFPWATYNNRLYLAAQRIHDSTFAHELGHNLGLLHTHTTMNGAELVNGSNCSTAGDLLCDTPADPKLSSSVETPGAGHLVSVDCAYTGNASDAMGNLYQPSISNFMSYARSSCRNHFTPDQIDRMVFYYENYLQTQLNDQLPEIIPANACPAGQDTDFDGVCDDVDRCPGGSDIDADQNGIPDGCESCPPLDFSTLDLASYSQNGVGRLVFLGDPGAVKLYQNAWSAARINYTVTPDTVIRFDFKSTVEAEIHELSFDNELQFPPDNRFVLYGTQSFSDANASFDYVYTGNGEYQAFTIPIGNFFSGFKEYLVLSVDEDTAGFQTGDSYFRNIRLFEDPDGDMQCDQIPIVEHLGVESVGFDSASLLGHLESGSDPVNMTLLWGPMDGGGDLALWANQRPLGQFAPGPVPVLLSGLAPQTTYFFRFMAENSCCSSLAPSSESFTTTPPPFDITFFPPVLGPTNDIQTTVIPRDYVWNVLDNGSDPGPSWASLPFDDRNWGIGWAKLGYGQPGLATTISYGPDPLEKHITTFLRSAFYIDDPQRYSSGQLSVVSRGGGAVYLNAQEELRFNLQADATVETLANPSVSVETNSVSFSPDRLVSGLNQLAVEIHRSDRAGPELCFESWLVLQEPFQPIVAPGVTETNATSARLQFSIQSVTGLVWPTLYIGRADGGSSDEGWDRVIQLGALGAGDHQVMVDGLSAATSYSYRFNGRNTANVVRWTKEGRFRTHSMPLTGSQTPVLSAFRLGGQYLVGVDVPRDEVWLIETSIDIRTSGWTPFETVFGVSVYQTIHVPEPQPRQFFRLRRLRTRSGIFLE